MKISCLICGNTFERIKHVGNPKAYCSKRCKKIAAAGSRVVCVLRNDFQNPIYQVKQLGLVLLGSKRIIKYEKVIEAISI